DKWTRQGDVPGARAILEEAHAANPRSEPIVLAAVKLETAAGQHARALALLERARETDFGGGGAGTARVWMKSAVLLRELARADDALALARTATARFPAFHKLWLVQAQLEQQLGRTQDARQTLSRALKSCARVPELWAAAAQLELAAHGNATRARAILERARVYVPRSPALWLAAVRVEAAESDAVARTLLARALQECPAAGALWAEAIVLEPRALRKAKSVDALKHVDAHDPAVTVAVARLFWSERRVDKARAWFGRAAAADPDYGDAWAWWLRFEREQHAPDAQAVRAVEDACVRAQPRHGHYWPIVAKDPANARLATRDVLHKTAELLATTRQL
ncbi:U4/U6 x U5 tri-snRNP complex subunit Prp1, partial [Coemansia sp. RSA 2611]